MATLAVSPSSIASTPSYRPFAILATLLPVGNLPKQRLPKQNSADLNAVSTARQRMQQMFAERSARVSNGCKKVVVDPYTEKVGGVMDLESLLQGLTSEPMYLLVQIEKGIRRKQRAINNMIASGKHGMLLAEVGKLRDLFLQSELAFYQVRFAEFESMAQTIDSIFVNDLSFVSRRPLAEHRLVAINAMRAMEFTFSKYRQSDETLHADHLVPLSDQVSKTARVMGRLLARAQRLAR